MTCPSKTAAEIGRELGVSKHTIYAWKAKYGRVAQLFHSQKLYMLRTGADAALRPNPFEGAPFLRSKGGS